MCVCVCVCVSVCLWNVSPSSYVCTSTSLSEREAALAEAAERAAMALAAEEASRARELVQEAEQRAADAVRLLRYKDAMVKKNRQSQL